MTHPIGERIKKLRLASNVSQEDIANFIWINRVSLSNIESWIRKIKDEELQKIADFFELSPSTLAWNRKHRSENDQNRKMKDMILYISTILKDREGFWKTVLNKLLYFSDFNY